MEAILLPGAALTVRKYSLLPFDFPFTTLSYLLRYSLSSDNTMYDNSKRSLRYARPELKLGHYSGITSLSTITYLVLFISCSQLIYVNRYLPFP